LLLNAEEIKIDPAVTRLSLMVGGGVENFPLIKKIKSEVVENFDLTVLSVWASVRLNIVLCESLVTAV